MNTFTVRGAAAELRWGYHQAAVLASWEMGPGGTVTAKVISKDDFKVAQAPLTFVVPHPNGQWVYTVNSLQITGTTLTASIS